MLSGKWRPYRPGQNVLQQTIKEMLKLFITGTLLGEFTSESTSFRWIPHTKGQ